MKYFLVRICNGRQYFDGFNWSFDSNTKLLMSKDVILSLGFEQRNYDKHSPFFIIPYNYIPPFVRVSYLSPLLFL